MVIGARWTRGSGTMGTPRPPASPGVSQHRAPSSSATGCERAGQGCSPHCEESPEDSGETQPFRPSLFASADDEC